MVKRRKVERAVEEGGEHTKDWGEAKREEQTREDVFLLAEDATNERIVFAYRDLRPVQVMPTNMDKDKEKIAANANATPGIGFKRPREEQDDEYEGEAHTFCGALRGRGSGGDRSTSSR